MLFLNTQGAQIQNTAENNIRIKEIEYIIYL